MADDADVSAAVLRAIAIFALLAIAIGFGLLVLRGSGGHL
jgi:hypothetical protein